MSTFANELSLRLTQNSNYWEYFGSLQNAGAVSTLSKQLSGGQEFLEKRHVAVLLYCASIFAQTENDKYKSMAQSIAFNSLLLGQNSEVREKCVRILTELGNFPGVTYVENTYGKGDSSLLGMLQRRVSQGLNTIDVGGDKISLTDYQREIWDALPDSQSLAISAPTSAGKSFLIIEYLCRLASTKNEFSCVYIAPTRALLSEVYQKIKTRLSDVDGMRVSAIPSIDGENNPRQIYVLTQERLQVLLAISDLHFDLVIVDEAQNLSDGSRGMILQECLEQITQRTLGTRIIMLSPGAEGFSEAAHVIGLPDLKVASTTVSPVLQNRILVNKVLGKNELRLDLLSLTGKTSLGVLQMTRGLDVPATRLAAVALELGSTGGSLVYATGPANAETIASQLFQARQRSQDERLEELATFIEKHIHPEYKLASMVRSGVAFHYGKMPTLLRESLEEAFKSGAIQYLVCTTTLFQGINLPARNVFIDTPTRGRGTVLDPALLWNFAGRAGRMRQDIVGNVFLVDYDEWSNKSMDEFVRFKIKPAFKNTLTESYHRVLDALNNKMPSVFSRDEQSSAIRASAGLLIARAARGDVEAFARRSVPDMSIDRTDELVKAAEAASITISLPSSLLASNWMIDPFGQKKLYEKILNKVRDKAFSLLIPTNPHETGSYLLYGGIFNTILKEVYGQKGNFGGYVATLAISWMKGIPYPVILAHAIKSAKARAEKEAEEKRIKKLQDPKSRVRTSKPVDTSKVIRDVFDTIEDVVRFQFVQLGKAYIDLLTLALKNEGRSDLVPTIFDFSLALELGVATMSGRSYVELGLSRIAASALDQLYPDSNLTVSKAREWLWNLDTKTVLLSTVIIDEMRRLELIRS
jgi:hypothetical protein